MMSRKTQTILALAVIAGIVGYRLTRSPDDAGKAAADAATAALIYLRLTCGSPLTYPKV